MTDYLSMLPASTRSKARFMALAAAVFSQTEDLFHLVRLGFPAAWSLDTAAGAQLDALGSLLNVSRPEAASDEDYRFLLQARIAAHRWNGTNETLPAVLADAFPGREARMLDNLDGTVTLSLSGETPFPLAELFPVPAGIQAKEA